MRLVMMGTGPFAAPMFRALLHTKHIVPALVTQPRPKTPGGKPPPLAPMREIAAEHGIPILDPTNVNSDEARADIALWKPDLLVVADYGQILSPQTLSVAALGGINLHGSLLPKYRGAAPINWALFHGDAETGVTVIHMTPRVDAGPALAQAVTPIDPDENAVQLEARLAELGAELICRVIDDLETGHLHPLAQDAAAASPARRLRKADGEVEWSRSAVAIRNQVRAFEPWPRTSTWWHRAQGEPLRLILGRVSVQPGSAEVEPGRVMAVDKDRVLVGTGEGLLSLDALQPSGKRMLSIADFLRGYPIAVGDRLGPMPTPGDLPPSP
jgi:methionyl-tRNA formyltransferase